MVLQLASSGEITPSGSFELMVVFPTLIGLVAAFVGAVAGAVVLARGSVSGRAVPMLMTLGHWMTLILAVAIVVWAVNFGSTGWELLLLPTALMFGQILVVAGEIVDLVRRRRATHADVVAP